MAQALPKIDPTPGPLPAAEAPQWSGEVYGSVAAMHRAIEAGLGAARGPAVALPPVERTLRTVSRLVGWSALAVCAMGVATALA